MTNQHPITPPLELVQQWREKWNGACGPFAVYLATQAARWGADQELEACIEWARSTLSVYSSKYADDLCDFRRPDEVDLKLRSIQLLNRIKKGEDYWQLKELDIIYRALGDIAQ
jgi:hypothetical protein